MGGYEVREIFVDAWDCWVVCCGADSESKCSFGAWN